jgi:hypothetical protein
MPAPQPTPQETPDTAPAPIPYAPGITRRSIILGFTLSVVHTCWMVYQELALLNIGEPTILTIVPTVIGIVFTLLAVNSLLKKIRPQWVFTPPELMVVFTMTTFGVLIAASKFLHYLFPIIMLPYHQAAQSGDTSRLASLPRFFAPQDASVVRPFFLGTQDFWAFFRPEIFQAWLLPLAFWGLFIFLLMWTMLCLSSLFRRQWVDRERIPFPILELPIMLAKANDAGSLFSNRFLLTGFSLTSAVISLNYLSSLYPTIPRVGMAMQDIGSGFFVSPPWSTINPLMTVWWPFAIGLCYMIPLDVAFSCWFFFLLIRLLAVLATAAGWRDVGSVHDLNQFPYFGNLAEGAWLGMFAVVMWNSRALLRQIWNMLRCREKIPGEETEAISYRTALFGAGGGFLLLALIGVLAGMRPSVALLAFSLYFIAIIVMARMYAQVALPLFCMAFFSFSAWTTTFTGTRGLLMSEKATLTTFYWFDRTYEQIQMGHQLEAMVFADRLRQSRRTMFRVMLISITVGIVVGSLTLLQIYYDRGASSARVNGDSVWLANLAWSRMDTWTASPRAVELTTMLRTAISAGIVILLAHARSLWFGFPLHPVGYLFASSFALEWGMWNIVFVTWLIKALVVRYGGLHLYRRTIPFFLGMALGDCVTQFAWGVGLSLTGVRGASPY